MANQILEEARRKSQGQKAAITGRHQKAAEPTIQELITGVPKVASVDTPVMLEGIDEAQYGQGFKAAPETPEVTALLDEIAPQTAQTQAIPDRPAEPAQTTQIIEVPQGQVVGQVQDTGDLLDPQGVARELKSGYNQKAFGIADEAVAQAEQANQISKIQLDAAKKEKVANDQFIKAKRERVDQLKLDGEELKKVLRAPMKVDPSQWWNSRTTGQKISGGIAALLSGFGGSAVQIMQKAISDDIAAQKYNYETKKSNAMSIYKIGKDMGLADDEINFLANISARRNIEQQMKGLISKTSNPVIKARGTKALGANRVAMAKDLAALSLARTKSKSTEKDGKLTKETIQGLTLSKQALGSIKRMRSAFKKGQWTRSLTNNEFKTALREASLLIGFKLSGANVAEREAKEIEKMLKGDITQSRDSILRGFDRWVNSLEQGIVATRDFSGLTDQQKEQFNRSFGISSNRQNRQPKTFKPMR